MTFTPPRPPVPSRIDEVPRLASFLLAQGIATLAWAAFCTLAAAFIGYMVASGNDHSSETKLVLGLYCAFAVGAAVAGTLQVLGAGRARRFRGRTFVMVVLWSGVASFPCGTICCLPTGIALVVYGMTVLLDAEVAQAFN